MAGVRIHVREKHIRQALNRLAAAAADPRPALEELGEVLLQSTYDRFGPQQAPDGSPWAPLSPKYRARKPRHKDRILLLSGNLRDNLRWQLLDAHTLAVGTNEIYGATHQLGDTSRNIPARPFLGLSPADESTALDIFRRHLDAALDSRS
ncbi:MAG: phage virion morphogenesis protein [Gammaproteobacteria bacterium]|nr:phage virion morphogenesis protein [Gammaproteobacteria bacterium]